MAENTTMQRAQACAVPEFSHVAQRKLQTLLDRGYRITGYALEKPQDGAPPDRGFINHGGFVGWWMGDDEPAPAAAPGPHAAELAACPFCGCSMRVEVIAGKHYGIFGDHDPELCIWGMDKAPAIKVTLRDSQLKAMVACWNRRAAAHRPPVADHAARAKCSTCKGNSGFFVRGRGGDLIAKTCPQCDGIEAHQLAQEKELG